MKKALSASAATAAPNFGPNSSNNSVKFTCHVALPSTNPVGMRNDESLRVLLPPLQTQVVSSKPQLEKPRPEPVVGFK